MYTDNIITSICTILDDDPGSPKIQHLQAIITSLRSRIVDLTDKIGVGYFSFNSHTPPSPAKRGKSKSPSTITPPRIRRGKDTTINIYLSPDDTSTLCGGFTAGLNEGKLCHNPSRMSTKHPSTVAGYLLPFHAYLTLPGSFIIHPFPLFCYKYLSQDTIKKLKLASITAQESATGRCLINTSPLKGKEYEIPSLLDLPP